MISPALTRRSLLPAAAAFAAVPAQARAPSLDFVVIGDWGRNGRSHQRDGCSTDGPQCRRHRQPLRDLGGR